MFLNTYLLMNIFEIEKVQLFYEKMLGNRSRIGIIAMEMRIALTLCSIGNFQTEKDDDYDQDGLLKENPNAQASAHRSAISTLSKFPELAWRRCAVRPFNVAMSRAIAHGRVIRIIETTSAILRMIGSFIKLVMLVPEVLLRITLCACFDYLYSKAYDLKRVSPGLSLLLRGIIYLFKQFAHRTSNILAFAPNLVVAIIDATIDLLRVIVWLITVLANSIRSAITGQSFKPDFRQLKTVFIDFITSLGKVLLNISRLMTEAIAIILLLLFPPAGITFIILLASTSLLLPTVAQFISWRVNIAGAAVAAMYESSQAQSIPSPALNSPTKKRPALISNEKKAELRETRRQEMLQRREGSSEGIELAVLPPKSEQPAERQSNASDNFSSPADTKSDLTTVRKSESSNEGSEEEVEPSTPLLTGEGRSPYPRFVYSKTSLRPVRAPEPELPELELPPQDISADEAEVGERSLFRI